MCQFKLGKVFGMGAVLGFVWGGGFVGYHILKEIESEALKTVSCEAAVEVL